MRISMIGRPTRGSSSRPCNRRARHGSVLLQTGKVLVCGGLGGSPSIDLSGCQLYDPTANTWSTGGYMSNGRSLFSLTLLQDGRVVVAGGVAGMAINTETATTATPGR